MSGRCVTDIQAQCTIPLCMQPSVEQTINGPDVARFNACKLCANFWLQQEPKEYLRPSDKTFSGCQLVG